MNATATRKAVLTVREIPADLLPFATDIVEGVNRRAAKAGIEGSFEIAHSTTQIVTEIAGWETSIEDVTTIAVLGEPLRLGDFEFVATIAWDEETGLATTRVVPGVEVDLSRHRDAKVCEHCNLRRDRKDTFVVRNRETGETTQVGRSCLAAFLGLDPTSALWLVGVDFDEIIDRDVAGWTGGERRFPLVWTVGLASAAVAEFGWVPASSWDGRPTRSRVEQVLVPPSTRTEQEKRQIRAENDAITGRLEAEGSVAKDRADAVVAWVRDTLEGDSEYVQNLKAAFAGETISQRNLGLVVSSISAWSKAQEREIERAARAARPASVHVGSVKERLRGLQVTVDGVRFFDGQFGTTTLLTLVREDGAVFKWFASGSHDYALGTVLTLDGTVKAHDEFNGQPQTVLTRCSIK